MAALAGNQVPRVANHPKAFTSDAEDTAFLAESYGLKPDPWQLNVLNAWMGRGRDGKWAAGRWGIAVPRQNGKNGILEMVELFFMAELGLKILHTAHEVKTARKAFLRIASFFENERKYPELSELVKEIRKTNGQEAIILTNGGSVEFIARSKGSGRGFTVDVLVCDEAQEYSEDAQAALLPTISSAPSGDPLQILLGTPPAPNMEGDVFTRMRSAGVEGRDKRLAWVEWSVHGDVDVSDRSLWAATNPSLGIRLNWTTTEDEFGAMSDETFARERLGMWASDKQLSVVPADLWALCGTGEPPSDPAGVFAVDMNHERTRAVVAVGVPGGRPHVEVAQEFDVTGGSSELVAWLLERTTRRTPVLVDAMSPARSIVPLLQAKKRKVIVISTAESMQACGGFYDAVIGGEVTHFQQEIVDHALSQAKKKKIGDAGGWVWDRKSVEVFLSPLIAVTLAHFGVVKFAKAPRADSKPGRVLVM